MVNRYGSPYVSSTTSRSPSPVRSDEKPPSGWNSEDEPAPVPDYEAIATKAKLLDFLGNTGEAQRCFEDPYSAEIFIELMHVKAGIELKEEDRERAIDFFERNAVYLGEIPIDWTATEFVVYSGWGHLLSGRDRSGASVLDRAILEGNKPLSLWLLEQNVTSRPFQALMPSSCRRRKFLRAQWLRHLPLRRQRRAKHIGPSSIGSSKRHTRR